MAFNLRSGKNLIRYSTGEQSLFALLPKDGKLITSAALSRKHYGSREAAVYNARKIITGTINSLSRKIEFNNEPFRLRKTDRSGPIAMRFWLEKRR